MPLSNVATGTADVFRNLGGFAAGLVHPTVRLGVTGLSRAGKSVFITSLVHNLIAGGRLPFFDAAAQGRVLRAYLEPQPNYDVPRFDYERHLADLVADPPRWPESTRRISQLRIVIEYQPRRFWKRRTGRDTLTIDIVDYPGEWLLDLPLLGLDYKAWSDAAIAQSRSSLRTGAAARWHEALGSADPFSRADEARAGALAEAFKTYLRDARADPESISTLSPGRFLMPGDLEGSPALTFAPLSLPENASLARGSLGAMMARRYEAYKAHVVRPFFRDHFARLDRQIVLVDALAALDRGPAAIADLERAMSDVLACFRTGSNSLWSSLFKPQIDGIVFAATKADHINHQSHDRLEAILGKLTAAAITRAKFGGAEVKVLAMAAIRATKEGTAKRNGEVLPCIIGYPLPGERIGSRTFDGKEAIAVFPGDLPKDPDVALREGAKTELDPVEVVRFRPPDAVRDASGGVAPFPNIRVDRALQLLIGDYLA